MEPVGTTSIASTTGTVQRRACASCTSAKTKCTRHAGDHLCERCSRLGKHCIYFNLPQTRRKQRITRRLEGLESRFDGLEAQLSAPPKEDGSSSSLTDDATSSTSFRPVDRLVPSSSLPLPAAGRSESLQSSPLRSTIPPPYLGMPTFTTGVYSGYVDIVGRGVLTKERAETLLADFRLHYAPLFPFVVLSSEATANTMRQESPLLFLVAISTALCTEPSLQKLLGEEFQAIISSQLMKQVGYSLDALQALLVYTAWIHYFNVSQSHAQLFLQTQLCVASVYHLNLDMGGATTSTEIRALLGTYYLSACVSRALRRSHTMKYSKRMEEYCDRLATTQEYETDRLIRPLVLSESLCCRVNDTFRYDDLAANTSIRGDAVVRTMVDSFMNELELIKMLSATDTSLTMIEFSYIQSYIQEGALHHELWDTGSQPAAQEKAQSRRRIHSGDLLVCSSARTTMVRRMLDSNKTCIRQFLATPGSILLRMPHTVNLRLCYVLASLIRLTFSLMDGASVPGQPEAPFDSSQQYSRRCTTAHPTAQPTSESANVLQLIDEMADKLETCLQSPSVAVSGNNAIVNGFVWKLKRLSGAYRSKYQSIIAGLFPPSDGAELMADCLKDGNLGLDHHVRTDQLQTNSLLKGRQTEHTPERIAGVQSGFWTLPEEVQRFDFDEREWESILESFILPE